MCLYHGDALISRLIRFLDGTEVNHASLFLGNGRVGEAIAGGLVRQDIQTSREESEWVLVRRLKDTPPMDPVLKRAKFYIDQGNRYAYEQLFLLAFLSITRKPKITPTIDALVRAILDNAATVLTSLLKGGKEPMICSEFVYRTYDEALPGNADVYSLWINDVPTRGTAPAGFNIARYGARGRSVRGSGIHPHSFLSLLASEPIRVRDMSEAASIKFMGPDRAAPVPIEELDRLIATYLQEVKAEPAHIRHPIERTDFLLRQSVCGFATALSRAHGRVIEGVEGAEVMALLAFSTRSPTFQFLWKTAADFVTPGDLLRTQSLFEVGKMWTKHPSPSTLP